MRVITNERAFKWNAARAYHEKLNTLMEQRNEIIGEAVQKHINVTMLFQHALQDLEQRKTCPLS